MNVVEYLSPGGREPWRIAESEHFEAEFGAASVKRMRDFHDLAQGHKRAWLIIRRLYGIGPVIVPDDADPDDHRIWGQGELAQALRLTTGQLTSEMDVVRAAWGRKSEAGSREQEAGAPSVVATEDPELIPRTESIEQYGFELAIFEVPSLSRTPADVDREKQWFTRRVWEWRKMLAEPMATTIARQALLNELHLRRIDTQLCRLPAAGKEFAGLAKTKQDIEEVYQGQLEALDSIFPWKTSIGGKQSFRGVISDLVRAVRDYQSSGGTELVDKIRTVAEVEVELRQSTQAPEARYRWGLQMAISESIGWIYDPQFRSQLKPQTLAKLDHIFRRAVDEARAILNEDLVDLEKDGPDGEFPDLQ